MTIRPQRLRMPRWSMRQPGAAAPAARCAAGGEGARGGAPAGRTLPRGAGDRCVRSTRACPVRGPCPAPLSPRPSGSAAGSAAGSGVPRRVDRAVGVDARGRRPGRRAPDRRRRRRCAICGRGAAGDDPLLEPLHLLGALGVLRPQLGGLERVDGDRGVEDQQPERGADQQGDDEQHERRAAGRRRARRRAGGRAAAGAGDQPQLGPRAWRAGWPRRGRRGVARRSAARRGVRAAGAAAGRRGRSARSLMPPSGCARRPGRGRTRPAGWPRPRRRRRPRRRGSAAAGPGPSSGTGTGRSGGVRSTAPAARVCLTMRSSSEWKVMTTTRPPTASASSAAGQRPLQGAELVVDLDAQRLERALGRVAAGAPGGGGDRRRAPARPAGRCA